METLMLATPPMTIKEVSDHLGFATPRSFARWLKRKDGILPREFRQVLCLFPRTPA
jgi:AraC-like DNA-binding protein